jgi:hypothetical protein
MPSAPNLEFSVASVDDPYGCTTNPDRLPRFEYNKCSTGLQRESRVTRFDLAITGGGINGCGIARGPFGLEYLKAAENLLGRARSRVCDKSSRAFFIP